MRTAKKLNAEALTKVGVATGSQDDLSNAIHLREKLNRLDVDKTETSLNLGVRVHAGGTTSTGDHIF